MFIPRRDWKLVGMWTGENIEKGQQNIRWEIWVKIETGHNVAGYFHFHCDTIAFRGDCGIKILEAGLQHQGGWTCR